MNKRIISLMAAALALLSASSQVSFSGVGVVEYPVIEVTPDWATTNLDKIYVVYDTEGVSMTYTANSDQKVVWCSYDANNWNYPDTLKNIITNGYETTLPQVEPNKGYHIIEGTTPYYCWVVNYADYKLLLNDMFFHYDSPCSLVSFDIDGSAPHIPYVTINGKSQVLDREIILIYNTQVWDDTNPDRPYWRSDEVTDTFPSLDQGVEIAPPLCNTMFTLTGDRFLKKWGKRDSIYCADEYRSKAVDCVTIARQEYRGEYTQIDFNSVVAGSSPLHIVFTGYPSEAVVYRRWEMATDQEFENVILQYYQNEVDYTFNDAGTFYLRYMVANDDGSCEKYSDTYSITVSESSLGVGPRGEIPNVLSLDNESVWKVSYKSLVEFHCWIFNRWGNLVYEFTDPDIGWDGTFRGKRADTGVYYYVITALGSDGVKYRKRGDITIIKYREGAKGTSNPDAF